METAEHELTLALASGSASLAGAELAPADVDISDVAQAAQRGCGGFEFVVREVHARLATRMRRAALIKGTFLSLFPEAKHACAFFFSPFCFL